MTTSDIEITKLIIAIIGLIGTLSVAIIAITTYQRNEKWKRAEFLAREMKEFQEKRPVQNTFKLIDWGSRSIPLLSEDAKDKVTREIQVHALLPHTVVNKKQGSDAEYSGLHADNAGSYYKPEEVAIRDSFDAFLDGLERFSYYVETGLVKAEGLRPYLEYWIDDIHSPAKDEEDAAWSAALLTYIQFYKFTGVQKLFAAFNKPIDPAQKVYTGFLRKMKDQELAKQIAASVNVVYTPGNSQKT
ncbi:MAG: hypothetical protein ABI675_21100 [Chitinophagaceae bacterium]